MRQSRACSPLAAATAAASKPAPTASLSTAPTVTLIVDRGYWEVVAENAARFPNDREAQAMMTKNYRSPWTLPKLS